MLTAVHTPTHTWCSRHARQCLLQVGQQLALIQPVRAARRTHAGRCLHRHAVRAAHTTPQAFNSAAWVSSQLWGGPQGRQART